MLGACALLGAPAALAACGAASTSPRGAQGLVHGGAAAHEQQTETTTHSAQARQSAPPPGSLPQTHALPPGTSASFRSTMAALWTGIAGGSAAAAMPAFFPRGAYLQVKEIADAGADYANRLVHDYSLDIGAAHATLGHEASFAALVGVEVPESYSHWVEPGTCYNRVGYYEVPNARIVYREGGQERSFGIASMISWRGRWYVVHLGSVLRSGESGVVDEPASGTGTSVDSGTC
jgi:hypothetical protein